MTAERSSFIDVDSIVPPDYSALRQEAVTAQKEGALEVEDLSDCLEKQNQTAVVAGLEPIIAKGEDLRVRLDKALLLSPNDKELKNMRITCGLNLCNAYVNHNVNPLNGVSDFAPEATNELRNLMKLSPWLTQDNTFLNLAQKAEAYRDRSFSKDFIKAVESLK